MLRYALCFLFATILSSAALAAPIHLGPETPLATSLDIGPAAYDQESPGLASNGGDFLAAWIDRRSAGVEAPLYATRVGQDGRPLDQFGTRLAESARFPLIATAGDDYLIAFTSGGSNVLRVDENGHPLAGVRKLSATREPRALASNGATYLLLESPGFTATILDHEGAPLSTVDATFGTPLWAGAYDGRYVVIDVPAGCIGGCKGAPRLNVISGTGSVISRVPLPFVPLHSEFLAAVASPDRIVITSHSELSGNFLVADYEGHIIRPLTPLPQQTFASSVAWDGRDFLLVFGDTGRISARRLSRDGEFLGDAFSLGRALPAFASNGTKQLLLWTDRTFAIFSDVIARTADDFAALATSQDEPSLVTYSPAALNDVRLVQGLAVWRDSNGAIAGALNGKSLSIVPSGSYGSSNPVVAIGKKNYLVAWLHHLPWGLIDADVWVLLARRVTFDGQVLDETPLALASNLFNVGNDRPGIVYDGNSFVVTAAAQRLYVARVSDEGAVEERRMITILNAAAAWPDPVSTASRVLIPHAYIAYQFGCDVCEPQWSIGVDGQPILWQAGTGNVMTVAAATDRDRVTLAWMSKEGATWTIQVAQLGADGQVIAAPRRLRDVNGIPTESIDLAWNGSEYVLAWGDNNGRVHAMRLNRYAEALDSEPFDVAQQLPFARFSLAPSPSGVTFGYDRVDAASANVTRAFARILDRLQSGPPRRSVRH